MMDAKREDTGEGTTHLAFTYDGIIKDMEGSRLTIISLHARSPDESAAQLTCIVLSRKGCSARLRCP